MLSARTDSRQAVLSVSSHPGHVPSGGDQGHGAPHLPEEFRTDRREAVVGMSVPGDLDEDVLLGSGEATGATRSDVSAAEVLHVGWLLGVAVPGRWL